VAEAFEPLGDSPDPATRLRAGREALAFLSSALDIAVGSSPEVDLLDMLTLVALGRDAVARRWPAATYGAAAGNVQHAFETSLDDVTALARGVISVEVEKEIWQLIRDWQRDNPTQDHVASVRLSEYAKFREGTTSRPSGVLSLVRGAAAAADTAVLLGERALYAAQRLPYLVRLQTRVASGEMMSEAARRFTRPAFEATRAFAAKALVVAGGVALAGAGSWLLLRVTRRHRHAWR
jgi:hypothetical protein